MSAASAPAAASAPSPSSKPTRIVDLRPSLQAVTVQFIVLERGETTSFRKMEAGAPVEVQTSTARVADATACATLSLTGADECAALQPGDVFRLAGGLFALDRGGRTATLRAGRRGTLERLGHGDFVFVEGPDMSSVGYERESGSGGGGGGVGGGGFRPLAPLPTKFWAPPSLLSSSASAQASR